MRAGDAVALAGVDLVGVTTVTEHGGKRAGYVRYALDLEGHSDIPVAAGADVSDGYYREAGLPVEERYWPEPVPALPGAPGEAIELLKKSVDQGATIIAIGPYTNLYLLDMQYQGILMQAGLFLMGGYVYPPQPGFPQWPNEADYNIQMDVRSAKHVIEHSNPTLVPVTITEETFLRRAYLDELRQAGPLGQLIARQAEAFAVDERHEARYGETCEGLPDDTINFQHDPLACAIALGWNEEVKIEDVPLSLEVRDGWLVERVDTSGKPVRVVTKIDGERFSQFWLDRMLGK